MTQTPKKCDVQICLSYNQAEDQRQKMPKMMECCDDSSLMADMSKLSLGRMKSVQNVFESSEDRRDACCS